MKMIKYVLSFALIICSIECLAVTKIDITKGNMDPIPLAINDFGGEDAYTESLGKNIAIVVASNLERSGLFRSISQKAFIENISDSETKPNFPSWRQINATSVLAGKVYINANKDLRVIYKLWDAYSENIISSQVFISGQDDWRVIAHRISDEIYFRLTGENKYFNSKIIFISEKGPRTKKKRRLAIMDQDGENLKFISNDKHIVLTPRFSPDASKVLYLSYASSVPRVYLKDLRTGENKILGDFPGMSFAPRFAPDSKYAVMSVSRDGNSDIYKLDLRTLRKTKLTQGPYIDTSPFYSPKGKKIAFASDRSGKSQIYVMNDDGSGQHRITFGEGSYNTPAWSPRGDYIAFTKLIRGKFYIGVIRPDGSGERILATAYMVDSPSWSPNGRVIMYEKRDRVDKASLHTIDITGYHGKELVSPTSASDPTWSPLFN